MTAGLRKAQLSPFPESRMGQPDECIVFRRKRSLALDGASNVEMHHRAFGALWALVTNRSRWGRVTGTPSRRASLSLAAAPHSSDPSEFILRSGK
jgi:hypothetical protein